MNDLLGMWPAMVKPFGSAMSQLFGETETVSRNRGPAFGDLGLGGGADARSFMDELGGGADARSFMDELGGSPSADFEGGFSLSSGGLAEEPGFLSGRGGEVQPGGLGNLFASLY
jgi:hypothetical protein